MKDKIVVITGASSGIGHALARAFAARGAKLALGARRVDKLNELKAELQHNEVLCVETDVSVETDCQRLIQPRLTILAGLIS